MKAASGADLLSVKVERILTSVIVSFNTHRYLIPKASTAESARKSPFILLSDIYRNTHLKYCAMASLVYSSTSAYCISRNRYLLVTDVFSDPYFYRPKHRLIKPNTALPCTSWRIAIYIDDLEIHFNVNHDNKIFE